MGSPKKTISYRFDSVGNRVGMTDPDGGRFTYAYDAVNRINHLVNPQGDRTTYAYDPGGRRTVKKLANGTRASFSYDAASNLTRLANLKSDGTTISSFNYSYDRVGNRTAVLEADGSRVTWSYDDTYQLTGEHRTGTTPYEDSYSYDASGNRRLKVHDGARTTYSYDAANQLEWSEDASGRTTYTFDADGNQQLVVEPTGDRTTTSWDYENRTTLVQLPSGIRNTMAYEPGGLRLKLEESTGTKKFVWDDQNYLAETDGNDDTQVVYTNEPRLYGNLVSQRRGTDSHWYQFDAIGSTRELTDAAQTVTDTRMYDAWGAPLFEVGSTLNMFRYVGEHGYYGDSTRIYIRFRFYNALTTRWSSVDPLWGYVTTERYRYSYNEPVLSVDPSGLIVGNVPKCTPANGIEYRGGRGVFDGLEMWARSNNQVLQSETDISWTPDPMWFWDKQECCCCDTVAIIQVVTSEILIHDNPFLPNTKKQCYVDGGISNPFYPYQVTTWPCVLPSNAHMSDMPAIQVVFWSGSITYYAEQRFETCAVCASGVEGIRYHDTSTTGEFGSSSYGVSDLVIYGCVKWGHTYWFDGVVNKNNPPQSIYQHDKFKRHRFPDDRSHMVQTDVAGEEPSGCFKRAIAGIQYPGWPPGAYDPPPEVK